MTDFDIDTRLRFSQVTQDTREILKDVWKIIEPELSVILDAFYVHLKTEPKVAEILGSHSERLKVLQKAHWQRLFSGAFDAPYMNGVSAVGMVHKRIGLELRWYIAGYRFILSLLIEKILHRFKGKKENLPVWISAVTTVVMLDMELAISAYQEAVEKGKEEALTTVVESFGVALEKLEKGDLEHSIQTEVSGVFLKMKSDFANALNRLRETVQLIFQGSTEVQTSAQEIAQAATDLSSRTIQQAASLVETAAQTEEITKLVKKTAQNATDAADLVSHVKSDAENGGAVAEQASQVMLQIEQASSQIAEIIGVIDGISNQTNLLSLNAAIEAAHAGHAGKGFEVVAGEVRKLANQAREAAMKIKNLIKTSNAVTATGSRLVKESGDKFKLVVQQVASIEKLVNGISQASHEQAQGVEQINIAINEMSSMTNENSTMVQETMAAARSLEDLSIKQSQVLSFFKVR